MIWFGWLGGVTVAELGVRAVVSLAGLVGAEGVLSSWSPRRFEAVKSCLRRFVLLGIAVDGAPPALQAKKDAAVDPPTTGGDARLRWLVDDVVAVQVRVWSLMPFCCCFFRIQSYIN